MALSSWITGLAALAGMEPQRVNHALFNIVATSSIPDDASSYITISLESFPLPKRSLGIIEIPFLNEKRKFAGNPVWDDIQITYKDMVGAGLHAKFNAWWLQGYDDATGKVGPASGTGGYKRNGYAVTYDRAGTEIAQYNCFGIWMNSWDPGDADMAGEDYIRVNAGLVIDKVALGTAGTPPSAYSAV